MKDLTRNITLFCPICGNDMFYNEGDQFNGLFIKQAKPAVGRDISSTQTISRPAKGSAGKEGPYEEKTVVSKWKYQKER